MVKAAATKKRRMLAPVLSWFWTAQQWPKVRHSRQVMCLSTPLSAPLFHRVHLAGSVDKLSIGGWSEGYSGLIGPRPMIE
jgi:hypothetical protein